MRIARLKSGEICLVQGEWLIDVSAALASLPAVRYPYPRHDALVAGLSQLKDKMQEAARTGPRYPLASAVLASPIANPGKIVAAPVNYAKHLLEARADRQIHNDKQVEEIHRVGCFLKASSSVVGPGEGVRLRFPERRTDHEVELAVVIGRRASQVSARDALDYVAGYCIGLDITLRGPEERSFRKSIDSYTVLGPWLVTADEIPDPGALSMSIKVNGQTRQSANTRQLILDVPSLIAWCSSWYTLEPGDVLVSGTPEGVGELKPGDVMEAELESVGSMRVAVDLYRGDDI